MNNCLEIGVYPTITVLGLKTVEMRVAISLLARRHWDEGGPDVGVQVWLV